MRTIVPFRPTDNRQYRIILLHKHKYELLLLQYGYDTISVQAATYKKTKTQGEAKNGTCANELSSERTKQTPRTVEFLLDECRRPHTLLLANCALEVCD